MKKVRGTAYSVLSNWVLGARYIGIAILILIEKGTGYSVLAMEDALRLTSWLGFTGFTCFTGFSRFTRFTQFDVPKQDILRTFLTLNG